MADDLDKYLEFLYGGLEGYVYAPVKTSSNFESNSAWFSWPNQAEALRDWIRTSDRDDGSHVYISPAVYERPEAKKAAIKELQVAWIEFDGKDHVDFRGIQVPAAIVQSSSSTHLHCYWRIPPSTGEVVEETNRRLTYYLDADSSGWDCTQLLRPPTTTNRKHDLPVKLVSFDSDRRNQLSDFDSAPAVKARPLDVVSTDQLKSVNEVLAGRNLPTSLIKMVKLELPPVGSRSSFMTKLAYELAEEGLTYVEIVSCLHHADKRVGKFEGRSDQLLRLTQLAELALFKVLAEDQIAVYSYEDILKNTKDLEWILKPWLHTRGLMMTSSAPNVGKTQLMLQMLTQLSLGEPFLGLPSDSTIKHSMLFMSLEMQTEGLKYIMEKQVKEIPGFPQSFHIITEEASLTHYENLIEETAATIVLVDSFTELLDIVEGESDIAKARTVLKWTRKIRRRYSCAVVLIHHNRKATEGNKKPKGLADLEGSFRLGKDSDTVIQLWEDREGIEVSSVKCRYGEKGAFYTTRNPETLWFTRKTDIRESQPDSGILVRGRESGPTEESKEKEVLDASNGPKPVQQDSPGAPDIDLDFTGH